MKRLHVGPKMGLGFGIVILLALVLGGIASIIMSGVRTKSIILDQEYIPEVAVSNELERTTRQIMFYMRAYTNATKKSPPFSECCRKKVAG